MFNLQFILNKLNLVKGNNVKFEDQGMKNENHAKKIGKRIYCGIEERIQ